MKLGHIDGNINLGIVREAEGDMEVALLYFKQALAELGRHNMITSEIANGVKIKIATLLPRIMPATEMEIDKVRSSFSNKVLLYFAFS
jgi:hypothetical protein